VAVVMDENFRYELIVDEPLVYTQEESDEEIMLKVNDHLGMMIKKYPTQWFWMHNRWKQ
jgi:KDO2-lipid IV(A) lauroyltransferase